MARDGFVMYRSWWEAIRHLPREIQGEVLTAIVEYGLYGETTESLKPIAKAMLAMAKPQIDANQKRYENGVKGGEFGVLGGRPKKGQENPKETPPKPQGNPTETPKEKDKEKEKYKVSKENAYGVKETPESPAMPEGDSVDFEKNEIFQKECEAYALRDGKTTIRGEKSPQHRGKRANLPRIRLVAGGGGDAERHDGGGNQGRAGQVPGTPDGLRER